ncbi:hypothetical protein HNY73_004449 [Argiope bruennichi]|uniref:Uncharacterized protein n=1 Tax=Argiope bruennichi TaxID=94029 RepID=A0A8T0FTA1_ARGBR|nr:hypothetical protein HNY73_004449 [Argiope bruennichi]
MRSLLTSEVLFSTELLNHLQIIIGNRSITDILWQRNQRTSALDSFVPFEQRISTSKESLKTTNYRIDDNRNLKKLKVEED